MVKNKKMILWGLGVIFLFAVALAFILSLHGNANSGVEAEIVDVLYEANKAQDAERYLGKEAKNIFTATAEQRENLQRDYERLLNDIYDSDWAVEQNMKILQNKLSATTESNLRSIDLERVDYRVNSLTVDESIAKINVTWVSCERVIVENEEGRYVSGFPITRETVDATLKKIDGKWKVQSLEASDYLLGEEDESLLKVFSSFEDAYDYSMSVVPKDSGSFALNKVE